MEEHKFSKNDINPLETSKLSFYFGTDHQIQSKSSISINLLCSPVKIQEEYIQISKKIKTKYDCNMSFIFEFTVQSNKQIAFLDSLDYLFKNKNPKTEFTIELTRLLQEIFVDYFAEPKDNKVFLIFKFGENNENSLTAKKLDNFLKLAKEFIKIDDNEADILIKSKNSMHDILKLISINNYNIWCGILNNFSVELSLKTPKDFIQQLINFLNIIDINIPQQYKSNLIKKIKKIDLAFNFESTEKIDDKLKANFLGFSKEREHFDISKEDEKIFSRIIENMESDFSIIFVVLDFGCIKTNFKLNGFGDIFRYFSKLI